MTMKKNGERASIEEAKGPEPQRPERMRAVDERVERIVAELKNAGYKFEFENGRMEFVVSMNGLQHHIMKMDPFVIVSKNGGGSDKNYYKIEDVIKAVIINPAGNIYDTLHSPEFKNIALKDKKAGISGL